jgi:hypothetical protein
MRGNCNFDKYPVKNIVFLSPNFPTHYWQFLNRLKLAGLNVLGIGDTPYHELPTEIKTNLTEYRGVSSLNDYDGVYRHIAFWASVYGRPHRIESLNETWLEVEALLREDFNVPGLLTEDLAILRTKMGMHDLFTSAGIPHPPATMCRSPEHVKNFAQTHGYPLVLKPDIGVGAAGQFKVTSDADVDEAFAEGQQSNPDSGLSEYVAQKWCFGKIVTYDGMVDRHGKIIFRLSQEYAAGVMESVVDRYDMYFWTQKELPPALEKMGKLVVETLGLRERWFHNEFFRLEDGSYCVLEANLRPPGCWITDMMNFACETDVYQLWVDVIMDKVDPNISWETFSPAKHHICHIGHRRHGEDVPRNYTHSHHEILAQLGEKLLVHRELPLIYRDALGSDMFLTKHDDLSDLKSCQEFIQETVEIRAAKMSLQEEVHVETRGRSSSTSSVTREYDSKSPQSPMHAPSTGRKNSRGLIH